jgi:hypothetical protein
MLAKTRFVVKRGVWGVRTSLEVSSDDGETWATLGTRDLVFSGNVDIGCKLQVQAFIPHVDYATVRDEP